MTPAGAPFAQLEGGQLIPVHTNIIKRQKQHFHSVQELGELAVPDCDQVACHSMRPHSPEVQTDAASECHAFPTPGALLIWSWACCAGVDMILGCNGMVWITKFAGLQPPAAGADARPPPTLTVQDHEAIARVANAVRGLSSLRLTVSPASIQAACQVTSPNPSTACMPWEAGGQEMFAQRSWECTFAYTTQQSFPTWCT